MIHINTPFYTAGKQFGWEHKPIGLGVRLTALKGKGVLTVRVGESSQLWEIDKQKALEFIGRNETYFTARNTKLGVIPWELFTKVRNEEPKDIFECK